MSDKACVATVVVTYNRKSLLCECLSAILRQSRPSDMLVIVDNASTDGTSQWLQTWLPQNSPRVILRFLSSNTGGAGGFADGMRTAIDRGAEWVWMMDDDAMPHVDALENLMKIAIDPAIIYGSLAVKGDDTSWVTTLVDEDNRAVNKLMEVPCRARVKSLPFLGFMIHRDLIERIGLPDAGFFIAADDVEYCMRARAAGADVVIAGRSRIEHPKSDSYQARLLFRSLTCLRLAPWKRYYDTRNRLLIARKYSVFRLITQTIPGSFVRLLAALIHEPNRRAQSWAFFAGMTDGILGRKGSRHGNWGIKA